MGEVEKSIPRINDALEYRWAESQPNMIQVEGKLLKHVFNILIDPRASYVI